LGTRFGHIPGRYPHGSGPSGARAGHCRHGRKDRMTDVMKLAMDRRAELHKEVSRIDDFIRMADTPMRKSDTDSEPGEETRDEADDTSDAPSRETATAVTRMNLLRRGTPAAAG